jgi:hypothetical protein
LNKLLGQKSNSVKAVTFISHSGSITKYEFISSFKYTSLPEVSTFTRLTFISSLLITLALSLESFCKSANTLEN